MTSLGPENAIKIGRLEESLRFAPTGCSASAATITGERAYCHALENVAHQQPGQLRFIERCVKQLDFVERHL